MAASLHRVALADAHEDEVIEDAFGRQRDVHDLGEVHLEDGQEEFHGRAADPEVFHRRDVDDGGIKRASIKRIDLMIFFTVLIAKSFESWSGSWK